MNPSQETRRHIFISYSRRDLDSAGRIVSALAERKLDTWIDWKSIPKGENWEEEIYRGIEEADAFIFLISPDSVRSAMCNKEIAHAVQCGKRILPVVLRDAATAEFIYDSSRTEIEKRNWVYYRSEKDDFTKAIDEIQITIRTDYEWLKFHTTLLNKALAWERGGRDKSRLLRGSELREIEHTIAAAGKVIDPPLTELQEKYVIKSTQARSRQRRIPTTILLMILFSIVLSDKTWYRFWYIPSASSALELVTVDIAGVDQLSAEDASLVRSVLKKEYVVTPGASLGRQDLLSVNVSVSDGDTLMLGFDLPDTPAYTLDFLPEIREFPGEKVSVGDAAQLIHAAAAYSVGRYDEAAALLENIHGFNADTLYAQASLFGNNFKASQATYGEAIKLSESLGRDAGQLRMGAALAWWGILDARSRSGFTDLEAEACANAFEQYEQVIPAGENEIWLTNLRIVLASRVFCNRTELQNTSPQFDANEGEISQQDAIAYFITALALSPDNAEEKNEYERNLRNSATHLNLARFYLSQYYRYYPEDCQAAFKAGNQLKNSLLGQVDKEYYRILLRQLPLFCSS